MRLLHRFPLARLHWPPFAAWQRLASSKTLINPPLSSELTSCWGRGGKLQSRELHLREGQMDKSSTERWGCWTSCLSCGSGALPGLAKGSPLPLSPSPSPSPQGLRARGWAGSVLSPTYAESPFSKLAVEGHLDLVLVPSPLVKGVTAVEGWAVQMQADSGLCVADVLHTVQANGVYTSEGMKRDVVLAGTLTRSQVRGKMLSKPKLMSKPVMHACTFTGNE